MSWAKIDDAILDNPKIAKAGVIGFAFHVAAISWCARNLTDGFIPRQRVASLLDVTGIVTGDFLVTARNPPAVLDKIRDAMIDVFHPTGESIGGLMVQIGLWHHDQERDGYWLHDYLKYNPTREKVLHERARKASNKRSSRENVTAPVTGAVTTHVTGDKRSRHHVPDPVPDPIREEEDPPVVPLGGTERPSGVHRAAKKRSRTLKTPWPEEFQITDALRQRAREVGVDLNRELDKAKNDSLAKDRRQANWHAFMLNWLARAPEFARNGKPPGAVQHEIFEQERALSSEEKRKIQRDMDRLGIR